MSTVVATQHLQNLEAIFLFYTEGTCGKPATIIAMTLASLGIRILEVLFFTGLVGSAVVVVISFIQDGKELFGDE